MKSALITGVTGQDGSYLAELLLQKGYQVHGIMRRSSSFNTGRIDHIFDRLHLHHGDLTEPYGIAHLLQQIQPDEVYNLAAQSHVKVSFEMPTYTGQVTALGALNLLEAIRLANPKIRFYQASSSEMFGNSRTNFTVPTSLTPVAICEGQDEMTLFAPRSPYAISKLFAHQAAINYRESYGMHVSCGILFNHESPRRGETFVTRKITRAAARIARQRQFGMLEEKLVLGNVEAKRDWGHARDYVEAMWLMLQQDQPDDYVIATGEAHSVAEFADLAFSFVCLDWRDHYAIDSKYYRPTEVNYLRGVAAKAHKKLGWAPKTTFKELVQEMVKNDKYVMEFKESR